MKKHFLIVGLIALIEAVLLGCSGEATEAGTSPTTAEQIRNWNPGHVTIERDCDELRVCCYHMPRYGVLSCVTIIEQGKNESQGSPQTSGEVTDRTLEERILQQLGVRNGQPFSVQCE